MGHHISHEGIKVDATKIEVISHIPIPTSQKEVRIFLGHEGYYKRFIEKYQINAITEQYHINHWNSTPYHPQAKRQVESTNKVLESILTKTIQRHHGDWANKIPEALWDYQIPWRNVTGHTPYELVYGNQVLLPIEFQIKTFRTATQLGMNLNEAQKKRLLQLE